MEGDPVPPLDCFQPHKHSHIAQRVGIRSFQSLDLSGFCSLGCSEAFGHFGALWIWINPTDLIDSDRIPDHSIF